MKQSFSRIRSIKKQSLPQLAIYAILAFMLVIMFSYHNWTRSKPGELGVIKWDVISYYGYLPATFIYGDVNLGFVEGKEADYNTRFWYYTLDNGNRLIQTSMGLSMLYSPFFLTAHLLAPLFGQARDGFSTIYQLFLVLSSLFYVMIGLIFLKRLLLKYFSSTATVATLVLVGLGTNLFYYTAHEGPMSHSYNFTLIILFLYQVIRWYENPGTRRSMWIGLIYGMIVLVRPSNIIVGVLFLFWGVTGWPSFRERILFLTQKIPQLLLMVMLFLLPWIPQLIYWKSVTGSFLFNSYGPSGSSFFFGSPHIFDVLFSFRKGWYLYTPVMFVATVGIYFLRRQCRAGILPISIYLVLQIYLLASWWSWWNGGSFGLRSFVDLYGVLALPLAAVVDWALKSRRYIAISVSALLLFFLYMNQFQTFQYTRNYIDHTGMTRKGYFINFLAFKADNYFWHTLSNPDAVLARLGIYYNYYAGDDNTFLVEMDTEEGMELVRQEIGGDKKLCKEILRHASRTGKEYNEAFEMVVLRVYENKIGK